MLLSERSSEQRNEHAIAFCASTHPGTTPAQVKAALVSSGTQDGTGDPDATHEPLVNAGGP